LHSNYGSSKDVIVIAAKREVMGCLSKGNQTQSSEGQSIYISMKSKGNQTQSSEEQYNNPLLNLKVFSLGFSVNFRRVLQM
jgi:hypothetical protein